MANIDDVSAYIAYFNASAAQRLAIRLLEAGDRLSSEPLRGRPIARGRRELTIIPPYLIRYRVTDDLVIILEVRHGARQDD